MPYEVEVLTIKAMRFEADRVDPLAAERVQGDDPQRLGRIISVYRATGRPLSDWQADTRPIIPKRYTRRAVILPDRETLYDRINRRLDALLETGALEEAKVVYNQSLAKTLPMVKAIGLSHLMRHVAGELSFEDAIELAKRDSRRLAKRQMTWFRNQMSDWPTLKTERDREQFLSVLT